ncbi:MAG: hypothetical protein Q7U52_18130 [Hydrogenophaga sp.]|uniref:methyltransferase domain-containing protein n=1 Tax=Hydrogenophaga sp. TaxID=1904254 RepID=UPI0027269543|nr:methyltransferase domain-containing protein [Hydrogenophaga sp.]MDO9149543.1 hypothetical protein [Hydrogenophaga sp.]MDP2407170.1 hypothetical protein [Hydrogenophaga sp.]MDZ4175899.1 hypothetical protein [Hydrogenophaga sp.]
MRILAHLKSLLRHPADYVGTYRPFRQSTDFGRWQNPSNLDPDWDERTQLIAGLIPDRSSVIEFGAARLVLPLHLRPGCTYQPVDLVKRTEDTLAFDLNDPLPALPRRYDYAVFSGVLEYVQDLDRVMRWLPSVSDQVIFSYAVTDLLSDPVTRRRNGWINSLSDTDVRGQMRRSGLECLSTERWQRQIVYHCRFLAPPSAPRTGQVRGIL